MDWYLYIIFIALAQHTGTWQAHTGTYTMRCGLAIVDESSALVMAIMSEGSVWITALLWSWHTCLNAVSGSAPLSVDHSYAITMPLDSGHFRHADCMAAEVCHL
jgi:hypothetical protein